MSHGFTTFIRCDGWWRRNQFIHTCNREAEGSFTREAQTGVKNWIAKQRATALAKGWVAIPFTDDEPDQIYAYLCWDCVLCGLVEETIERRDKFMAEYAKEKENGS